MTIGPLHSKAGDTTPQVDADQKVNKNTTVDQTIKQGSTGVTVRSEGKNDRVELQQGENQLRQGTYSLQEITSLLNDSRIVNSKSVDALNSERLTEIKQRIQNNFYEQADVLNSIATKMIELATDEN